MELRLYSFVNFYLSSIQQGVQTGHAAVDLVMKYTADSDHGNTVRDWASNHKTFIILNGGNMASLQERATIVQNSGLPYVTFSEDEQSLGGIMTTVAVVVPENIFSAVPVDNMGGFDLGNYYYQTPVGRESEFAAVDTYFPVGHKYHGFIEMLRKSRLAS